MSLFRRGNFTLASGASAGWKIDCEALTKADWETLALIASEILPPFGEVEGVPRGGILFAKIMSDHATEGPLLITEDVVTTGESMERQRDGREAIGITVFARDTPPKWVVPLFLMNKMPY